VRWLTAMAVALLLAGCGPQKPWHATDVTGVMPDLAFRMDRASDGSRVSEDNYRGRVVLLYFGYTHCPDICPTTLAYLSDVLKRLGPDAEKVRVLFVTVDPNRDTLKVLKPYAEAFGAQVDGMRGSDAALKALAQRYRVEYSVVETPVYSVTHTSSVYVFDDQGRARLVITDAKDTPAIAEDVRRVAAGE
jgi:protein SCO1/2